MSPPVAHDEGMSDTSIDHRIEGPIVSRAHGEWHVGKVPEAELRIVPDIGHPVPLTAWSDIMARLA